MSKLRCARCGHLTGSHLRGCLVPGCACDESPAASDVAAVANDLADRVLKAQETGAKLQIKFGRLRRGIEDVLNRKIWLQKLLDEVDTDDSATFLAEHYRRRDPAFLDHLADALRMAWARGFDAAEEEAGVELRHAAPPTWAELDAELRERWRDEAAHLLATAPLPEGKPAEEWAADPERLRQERDHYRAEVGRLGRELDRLAKEREELALLVPIGEDGGPLLGQIKAHIQRLRTLVATHERNAESALASLRSAEDRTQRLLREFDRVRDALGLSETATAEEVASAVANSIQRGGPSVPDVVRAEEPPEGQHTVSDKGDCVSSCAACRRARESLRLCPTCKKGWSTIPGVAERIGAPTGRVTIPVEVCPGCRPPAQNSPSPSSRHSLTSLWSLEWTSRRTSSTSSRSSPWARAAGARANSRAAGGWSGGSPRTAIAPFMTGTGNVQWANPVPVIPPRPINRHR